MTLDLPILIFTGSFWLLVSYEVAGGAGLIFPGVFGWAITLVALIRTALVVARRRTFRPPYVSRRAYAAIWAFVIAMFLLSIGAVLVVNHMPQAWKDAVVKSLNIRRVYRNYGPP